MLVYIVLFDLWVLWEVASSTNEYCYKSWVCFLVTKTPPTLGHRSSSSMPQQQLDQLHHETGSCGSSSPSSHASPIDDQGRMPPSLDLKTSHSHNQLPEVVMECPSPRR